MLKFVTNFPCCKIKGGSNATQCRSNSQANYPADHAATAAAMAATPVLAQECPIGPPPHEKGPRVWMDLDQVELDAAYDQGFYAPLGRQITTRRASNRVAFRSRF